MQPSPTPFMPLIIFCQNDICGAASSNPDYNGVGQEGDEFTFDNLLLTCPHCGHAAQTMDGIYRLQGKKLLRVRDLPAETRRVEKLVAKTNLSEPAKPIDQISECGRCGNIFPSEMQYDFTSYDNPPQGMTTLVPHCPKCRTKGEAGLPAGLYHKDEYSNNTVRLGDLLSDPEFTPEVLQRLKTLVEQTQAAPEGISEFIEKANAISPSLGKRLDSYLGDRKNIMELLKLLLAIIGTTLAGMAYLKGKPAPVPATIINNTYNFPLAIPLSAKQSNDLRRLQNRLTPPRGSNLTPPKKNRPRKK